MENAINETIPYMIPYVGEALMARDLYSGAKDAVTNGLNLSNGSQMLFSALPLGVGTTTRSLRFPKYLGGVERRGIETLMRTSSGANPAEPIKQGIQEIISTNPARLVPLTVYGLTGYRWGPKGYYNSLAHYQPNNGVYKFWRPRGNVSYYSGFEGRGTPIMVGDVSPSKTEVPDLIDAYLYKKPIDPAYGVVKVNQGDDFGVFKDYVAKNYANKAENIPVYEVVSTPSDTPSQTVAQSFGVRGSDEVRSRFPLIGSTRPNVGGHNVNIARMSDGNFGFRLEDIWKFNSDEYMKRWKLNNLPWYQKKLYKKMLDEVDRLGTPVVTRTKWSTSPFPESVSNFPSQTSKFTLIGDLTK